MKLKEFKKANGGVHALVMRCTVKHSFDNKMREVGDEMQVLIDKAFGMYKTERWVPAKGMSMPKSEAAALNKHFKKEHEKEMGDSPKSVTAKAKK